MAKQEETYHLTPLGLLGDEACDEIIVYMVKTGYNAIVWDNQQRKLLFTEVEIVPNKPKKKRRT